MLDTHKAFMRGSKACLLVFVRRYIYMGIFGTLSMHPLYSKYIYNVFEKQIKLQ